MGERLSSLTRRIRNALATWCEFFPKVRKETKQSPFVEIFLQPNSNEDQKTQGLHPNLCDCYPPN